MNDGRKDFITQCRRATESFFSRHKHQVLVQYKRDSKNCKVGVVVAFKDAEGVVRIGMSKCHVQLEKFDRYIGLAKAIDNAYKGLAQNEIPNSLKTLVNIMVARATRYFKVQMMEGAWYEKSKS